MSFGRKHSEEFKEKMRGNKYGCLLKGYKRTEEQKKNISEAKKNQSEDTKRKIGNAHKGKILTDETKNKIRLARKGRKHSKEQINKMSLSMIGKNKGEKNGSWNGGTTKLKYPSGWTNTLKNKIRERDKYRCKICSKLQKEITFHIHHIDYDKENINTNNLVTLCHSCHTKTNFNRDYWKDMFLQKNL